MPCKDRDKDKDGDEDEDKDENEDNNAKDKNRCGDSFFENFLTSVMEFCLGRALKDVNDSLVKLKKSDKLFKLLYSPSITNLLNSLNTFRRCIQIEDNGMNLTD